MAIFGNPMPAIHILLIPKRIHIHIAADTVHLAGAGVLPSATVGRERVESHASAILRHPRGFGVNVGMFQRSLQVAGVRVNAKILVSGGL